jgi:predicted ester cyclase
LLAMSTLEQQQQKDVARRALEEVCARGDFAKAEQFYSPAFRDHVNSLEFRGLEGVRQSVGMYRAVFPDLEIQVDDQVVDGDRVASRWTARGTNRGRRATVTGITISHIQDGKIVERCRPAPPASCSRTPRRRRSSAQSSSSTRATACSPPR